MTTASQHDTRITRPESASPEARNAAINDEAWLRLQAGRAYLIRKHPYLASAVYKMRCRRTSQVPTLASDAKWRMYWNPTYVLGLPIPEIASAWEHEASHVLRHHPDRFEAMHEPLANLRLWNIACDGPINFDIARGGLPLGTGWVTLDQFEEMGVQPGMTSEQIYALLKQHAQSQQNTECSHEQGDGEESGNGVPCPQCSQQQDGDGDASGGGGANDGDQYGRGCGSSVGGPARDWEDPSDDDAVTPGEAELTRQSVARDIAAHERTHGRGSVAGGWSSWAEEMLNPKIDWRKVLRSKFRATLANLNGRVDYSYARPSRRQIPGVILPAMVKPEPPNVEVVVDTSGSVSDDDLKQALGEIDGVFKAQGRGKSLMVTMCDSVVHPPQAYSGQVKKLQIHGRGGTDMRKGIKAAAERRPRNKVIITITDGLTPWPDEKPSSNRDAIYIVVLFEQPNDHTPAPPEWMTTLVIPQDR